MLLDLLYPKTCLSCGKLGNYICANCEHKLEPVAADVCIYCQKASYLGLTHPACKRELGVDGFISIFHYNPVLKKIIKNIKYRLVTDAFHEFFSIWKPEYVIPFFKLKTIKQDIVLQPVPLHTKRIKERGFNQSHYIAQFMAELGELHMVDIVKRTRYTPPQAQIRGKKERYLNIKDAFEAKATSEAKKVLLVDDVITSGSTIKEITRALKLKTGVEEVYAFSLARG